MSEEILKQIDSNKFGEFGTYMGGEFGTLFSGSLLVVDFLCPTI